MVLNIARTSVIVPLRASLKQHIKRGGLVAYATESCFGLGCDPQNAHALKKLLKLKQRDKAKGLIVIGAHLKQLKPLCATLSNQQLAKLRATWPAAHTWVVPAADSCSPLLTGGRGSIAVRVPAHQGARNLCILAGMAIVSTSANLSGQKSIKTYQAALRKFSGRVWVLPGKIGHYRKPSTVQDLVSGNILRK